MAFLRSGITLLFRNILGVNRSGVIRGFFHEQQKERKKRALFQKLHSTMLVLQLVVVDGTTN